MAKRKRDVPVLFWVSAEELELIHQKMQQYGTENLLSLIHILMRGSPAHRAFISASESAVSSTSSQERTGDLEVMI